MKLNVKRPVQLEVDAVRLVLPVLHGTEDIPDDFPGRDGDELVMVLDLAENRVLSWPAGRGEDVFLHVVDGGSYQLIRYDRAAYSDDVRARLHTVVADLRNAYVPPCLPQEDGDYLAMKIDAYGGIQEQDGSTWTPSADDIVEAFSIDQTRWLVG